MSKLMTSFIVLLTPLLVLASCAGLTPEFYKTVDDITTDGVIQLQVDKEAFKEDTNVKITIDILNKQPKLP